MRKKIGILLPYSGEYPQIKRALLNPLLAYQQTNDCEVVKEFIDKGQQKDVEKAIEKLCYQEDADVIIAYAGYRVMVGLLDHVRKYPDKLFIHLSLGEIIPYTHAKVNYPANYCLVSANAWQSVAFLGRWIADKLPAKDCLICTSLYDAGYSFDEAFRIGYHSEHGKPLNSCMLNNAPKVFDVSPLYENILKLRPQHIHVALCGRELKDFINNFSTYIDYTPTVSFAFPVFLNEISTTHPSFKNTYTCLTESACDNHLPEVLSDPVQLILGNLVSKGIEILEETTHNHEPENIAVFEIDLIHNTVRKTDYQGLLPQSLNGQFNHSAENALSFWQNPYLCI